MGDAYPTLKRGANQQCASGAGHQAACAIRFPWQGAKPSPFEGPATVKPPALPVDTYCPPSSFGICGTTEQAAETGLSIRPSNSVTLSHPFRKERGKDGAPTWQYLRAGSIIPCEKAGKCSSGPKGPIDSAGFMRGLKPPPSSGPGFSAACKAHAHFAAFTARDPEGAPVVP
jgi:hypothetical protein